MLKTDVEFLSDIGRRKGHTHMVVVFDTSIRREHHRFVAQGESVDTTVAGITLDRTQQIVQVVKLS